VPPVLAASALDNKQPRKVAVLVLENHGYGQIVGSPQAPYLNALARRSVLFTNYQAVTHPSLPNYLALVGGSTFGVRHDSQHARIAAPNLISQLDAHHIGWGAYFQSLPRRGYLGGITRHLHRRGLRYVRPYDPFVYFSAFRHSTADRRRLDSFRALSTALDRRALPAFSWIAPDLRHDGHSTGLRGSDRYLSRLVPRIVRALGPNGVLYLTWDENSLHNASAGGGHVPLIATGGAADHRLLVTKAANHLTLLHTIERTFGLPPLNPG
jgi:hypothetical protein